MNRASIEEAPVDEEVLYSGGENFDWHQNGLRWLGTESFSEDKIKDTKRWLSDVSKQANEAFEREEDCVLCQSYIQNWLITSKC